MDEALLDACEEVVGYEFNNRQWLHRALVHSSNKVTKGISNERLEFLGDSVLGMIVAEHLYNEYPDYTEGKLTKIKSVVVSRPALARQGMLMGLDRFVMVGPGMMADDLPETVVSNALEAVIAAIYLDGGLSAARVFVLRRLRKEIETVIRDRHEKNYKSLLQQLVQRKEGITPTYRTIAERGPDHAKEFCVAAVIGERVSDSAWGASKKAAEQLAAEKAYKHHLTIYGTKDE
ncbi:MAG: ribonuclease III [Planctomycetota bacterium]